MSEQLKVGDWVTVTSVGCYFGSRRQYTCRVAKVLPSGSLRVDGQFSGKLFRLVPYCFTCRFQANAELWLHPATPAEVATAEAEEAKAIKDAKTLLARADAARAWLASCDWSAYPPYRYLRIAEDLGWKGEE